MLEVDTELMQAYDGLVCGVDEAGRGPLAGPVFAAAVILPPNAQLEGLNDSKKLSEKRRASLFDAIVACALAWAVASASVEEIERVNILNATYFAMNRAIAALRPAAHFALIDGNRSTGIVLENRCVVRGDEKYACIAAASILAKVSRDRYMEALDRQYPQYAFAQHKGYATKLHKARIRQFGPSPVHRRSFLHDTEETL